MAAEVGDDVFGEDPSIRALEHEVAKLLNMKAALFCPSGTMANQIAIAAHSQPGDEIICSDLAHVFVYEGGGMAANAGVQARALPGDRGRITARQIEAAINPDDPHRPVSRLVCLENTVNRGGGCCYDLLDVGRIRQVCYDRGLRLHLDGARLFNALVERGESISDYGLLCDSVSICLSKGLGCPVGSVLSGSSAFIDRARRIRKRMGGGMRQAGYLAAAGLYALEHHVTRLADDHLHARQVAAVLEALDFVEEVLPVETNILIFTVQGKYTAGSLAERLGEAGIAVIAISETQIRMVFHLDVSQEMVDQTCTVLDKL